MFPTNDLNIQFGCCFALFLLWFLCTIPIRKAQKETGKIDNANPREQYLTMPGYGQRALYAHNNLNEGFVWFGFAILASIYGSGDPTGASALALIYTIARFVYVPLYILNYPTFRSLAFLISFLANLGLFILPFATRY